MSDSTLTTSSRRGPRFHAASITALGPSYMLALPSRPHGILVSARRGEMRTSEGCASARRTSQALFSAKVAGEYGLEEPRGR